MRVFFRLEKAMARQEIILGTPPTGLGGDTPRVASSKINAMTLEIYQGIGTPAAPLPLERGGTGGKTQATAQAALGLVPVSSTSDITVGRLVTPGWMGIGTPYYLPAPDPNAVRNTGYYYCAGTAATPEAYGFLRHNAAGSADGFQEFTSVTTLRSYKRLLASNVWGTWDVNISAASAINDPALGAGGLMSSATVSGYNVYKYANGLMCIQGLAPNVIPSVASNTSYTFQIALPVAFISASFTGPVVTVLPAVHNDHYGVVPVMTNGGVIFCVLRNGAGAAQTFSNVNVTVWGRWK